MPFRFRRSIKILPGVKLNLGKRGISTSVGVRGAHITMGTSGTRVSAGIPGTGLGYTEKLGKKGTRGSHTKQSATGCFVVPLVLFPFRLIGWLWTGLVWVFSKFAHGIDQMISKQAPVTIPVTPVDDPGQSEVVNTNSGKMTRGGIIAVAAIVGALCLMCVGGAAIANLTNKITPTVVSPAEITKPPTLIATTAIPPATTRVPTTTMTLTKTPTPENTFDPTEINNQTQTRVVGLTQISNVKLTETAVRAVPTLAPTSTPLPTNPPAIVPPPATSHPAGTSGKCVDGTYTSAAHKQGACSHHGGVAEWWGS